MPHSPQSLRDRRRWFKDRGCPKPATLAVAESRFASAGYRLRSGFAPDAEGYVGVVVRGPGVCYRDRYSLAPGQTLADFRRIVAAQIAVTDLSLI